VVFIFLSAFSNSIFVGLTDLNILTELSLDTMILYYFDNVIRLQYSSNSNNFLIIGLSMVSIATIRIIKGFDINKGATQIIFL
jgi:hypothetical protein